ncbi:hypothetical protein ACTG22_12840 [Aeromonas caviae]|uniref:hypothetical protein n=1 Tax=Aeromonas caviae TaxID=648 RepID=UPI003F78F96B
MEPTQTTESHNNGEITLQQAIDQARAARAAFDEWDQGERQRLLEISPAREKELLDELARLSELRMTGRASGALSAKEYRDLISRTGEIQIELDDIALFKKQELMIGHVQQGKGWPLYCDEVRSRTRIVNLLSKNAQESFKQRTEELIGELRQHLAQLRRYESILDDACHNEVTRMFDAQVAHAFTLGVQPAIQPSEAFIKSVVAQLESRDGVSWEGDAEALGVVMKRPPIVRLSKSWGRPASSSKLNHQIKLAKTELERLQQEELQRIRAAAVREV